MAIWQEKRSEKKNPAEEIISDPGAGGGSDFRPGDELGRPPCEPRQPFKVGTTEDRRLFTASMFVQAENDEELHELPPFFFFFR